MTLICMQFVLFLLSEQNIALGLIKGVTDETAPIFVKVSILAVLTFVIDKLILSNMLKTTNDRSSGGVN